MWSEIGYGTLINACYSEGRVSFATKASVTRNSMTPGAMQVTCTRLPGLNPACSSQRRMRRIFGLMRPFQKSPSDSIFNRRTSADFLGQRKVRQRTSGYSGGMVSRSYTNIDEHKIKPYEIRHLRKHQCVLVHCEEGFHKTILPSLEADGTVSKWFPWWKRLI